MIAIVANPLVSKVNRNQKLALVLKYVVNIDQNILKGQETTKYIVNYRITLIITFF